MVSTRNERLTARGSANPTLASLSRERTCSPTLKYMTVWFLYSTRSRSDELTSSASDQNGRSLLRNAACAAVIHPIGAMAWSTVLFGLSSGMPKQTRRSGARL